MHIYPLTIILESAISQFHAVAEKRAALKQQLILGRLDAMIIAIVMNYHVLATPMALRNQTLGAALKINHYASASGIIQQTIAT